MLRNFAKVVRGLARLQENASVKALPAPSLGESRVPVRHLLVARG